MNRHSVQVHLVPAGVGSTVHVDGERLRGVTGLTITHRVRELPQLTIDLLVHEFDVDGEMVVQVPERTAESLVTLGWTPPPGHDPGEDQP